MFLLFQWDFVQPIQFRHISILPPETELNRFQKISIKMDEILAFCSYFTY